MSVWGTFWAADTDDHAEGCAVWVPLGDHAVRLDRTRGCTCGQPGAPIAYRGSHVLPSEGDPRCGSVDLAEVPPHITRNGRDDGPEDEWTPWPFLRLGVGVECAVLDEALARSLYEALGGWLEQRGAR